MAEPHGQLMRYKKRRRRPSLFLRLRRREGFAAPAASRCCACGRGMGSFAAPAASRFSPDGEAASGGHISFCEERNVGKKVA